MQIDVVWTSVGGMLPHLGEFRDHNPGTTVWIDPAPLLHGRERVEAWRNGDRRWLAWWKDNRGICVCSHVLFLEWDTRFAAPLQDVFRQTGDFFCPKVETPGSGWCWWREIPRLPGALRQRAAGTAPLGALLLSRRALNAILAHPCYDDAMRSRVFCELRLPTLATAAGYPPRAYPALANVRWKNCNPRKPIAHPMKA